MRSGYIAALRVAQLRSKLWLKRQPVKLLFMASYFSGFSEGWGFPVENWRNSFHTLRSYDMLIASDPFDL